MNTYLHAIRALLKSVVALGQQGLSMIDRAEQEARSARANAQAAELMRDLDQIGAAAKNPELISVYRSLGEANEKNAELDRVNEATLIRLNETRAQLARANADLEAVSLKLVESENRNELLVQAGRGAGVQFADDDPRIPAISDVTAVRVLKTPTGGFIVRAMLVQDDDKDPFVVIGDSWSHCGTYAHSLGARKILSTKEFTLRKDDADHDESE
jgi:hypothetical protein